MDMNKMMKNIFLFLLLAVVFACADDIIPEEGFIPMNPENGTENSQANPYWAWVDKFPGPISQQLPRLEDTLVTVKGGYASFAFNEEVAALQSTGLYAPPGEILVVRVPEGTTGLHYRIGIHARKLANGQVRLRYEDVSVAGELVPGENRIMNWFGGFLYFYYPAEQVPASDIQVSVNGGVATHDYILGQTDWQKWIGDKVYNLQQDTVVVGTDTTFQDREALNWTELRSDKVIVSIGTPELKEVANPETILELYGKIVDAYYAFKGLDATGQMPIRVYTDVELPDETQTPASPGTKKYMVGEYPLGFIRGEKDKIVDAGRILNPYILQCQTAEQYEPWFTLFFAFNEMFRSSWEQSPFWKDVMDRASYYYYANRNGWWPEQVIDFKAYLNEQKDPLITKPFEGMTLSDKRLTFFMQLVNEVGWELFPYLSKKSREQGFTEEWRQDPVDFFMMGASEYAGLNLTDFFRFWLLPISPYALNYMNKFPNPEVFWLEYDQNKMGDFTPRTPDLSHDPGPKPVISWLERTGWKAEACEAVKPDGTYGNATLGFADNKGLAKMLDGNTSTLCQCKGMNNAVNKWRLAIDLTKKETFNTIYMRTFNLDRAVKMIEKVDIWQGGKWVPVEIPEFRLIIVANQDNYFYFPTTLTTSKIRLTLEPNTTILPRSAQISEFNLGLYEAPASGDIE